MRGMPSRMSRPAIMAIGVAAALLGCSSDPEECARNPEQPFFLTVTEGLPAAPDSISDIVLDTDATFLGVDRYPGAVPPSDEYLFRTSSGNLRFTIPESAFPIPVEANETYRIRLEITQRLTPAAAGLRVSDAEGVRFLAVTDWRPLFRIQEDGYGDLAPGEELRVYLSDSGCDPAEEDSPCFVQKRNQQLEILIGSGRARLWHGDTADLEGFAVRAHKAMIVEAKQGFGCEDAVREQNGVSFSLVRAALR